MSQHYDIPTPGEYLRNLRNSLNLGLQEAADGLGYSKTTLGRIERNEKSISEQEYSKLKDYYNVCSLLKSNYDRTVSKYLTLRQLMQNKHFVINTGRELAFLYTVTRPYSSKEGYSTMYVNLAHSLRFGPLYFYMSNKSVVFSTKEPMDSVLCSYSDLTEVVNTLLDGTNGVVVKEENLSIRGLRIKANVTLRAAAKAAGLSHSSFSYMERGLRKFPEGKEQQVRDFLIKALQGS